MEKHILSIALFFASISMVNAIVVSPNSACAGSTFTITITGVNYTAASSPCSSINLNVAGLTSGSNTNVVAHPTNMSIASSTMTMTFTLPGNFTPGSYGVNMHSGCPNVGSCSNCFTVEAIPQIVGNVSGPLSVCAGSTATYAVASAAGAINYNWTLPGGWTINGASNSNQIEVVTSSTGGNVSVAPNSTLCGMGSAVSLGITVVNGPPAANTISANGALLTSSSSSASQQWYLDGNLIAGAIGQTFTALVTGDYTVVESNLCGAGAASNSVHVVISGVNRLTSNKIYIYPNPVSDNLFIENGNAVAIKVELFH